MVKYANNIYYYTKNQVRRLCVGGDMTIFFLVCSMVKRLIFGTVIDIVSIFYHTKNQVGGLCVGRVSIPPGNLHHYWCKLTGRQPGNLPLTLIFENGLYRKETVPVVTQRV